jgi:hypothetical protein
VEKLNELRERIWAHYEKAGEGNRWLHLRRGLRIVVRLVEIGASEGVKLILYRSERSRVPDETLCEGLCGNRLEFSL